VVALDSPRYEWSPHSPKLPWGQTGSGGESFGRKAAEDLGHTVSGERLAFHEVVDYLLFSARL